MLLLWPVGEPESESASLLTDDLVLWRQRCVAGPVEPGFFMGSDSQVLHSCTQLSDCLSVLLADASVSSNKSEFSSVLALYSLVYGQSRNTRCHLDDPTMRTDSHAFLCSLS